MTVTIGEKTRAKIDAARADFLTSPSRSWEAWQSLFGLCVFAARALHLHRSARYWCYKFMRRKANALGPLESGSTMVTLWQSCQDTWAAWLNEILDSPQRSLLVSSKKNAFTLVTDSSLTGWGAVLYTPGEDVVVAGA